MTTNKPAARARPARTSLSEYGVLRGIIILGATQIISWGTTLYALGVLADPIIEDTGWSRSLVFGGLTAGLLMSSLVSTWIGRLIDRYGARTVMTAGSAITGIGLVWLANAFTPLAYLGAWCLIGLAMRMTLYDAAFAALVQISPANGRRAISWLTLFGGFASTLFWPIGHALTSGHGWRNTLLVFAALNLVTCMPLHWWGLPNRKLPDEDETNASTKLSAFSKISEHGSVTPALRPLAKFLFGITMFAGGFVIGTVAVHLVNLIAAGGLAVAGAVFVASFRGVAQVGGRIVDIALARTANATLMGHLATALLVLSLVIAMTAGASFAAAMVFTILLGAGQGIFTIVRGTVPLQLFGRKSYGETLGLLSTPYWLANALAPVLFAYVVDRWGYGVGEGLLLSMALIAFIAMQVLTRWLRR